MDLTTALAQAKAIEDAACLATLNDLAVIGYTDPLLSSLALRNGERATAYRALLTSILGPVTPPPVDPPPVDPPPTGTRPTDANTGPAIANPPSRGTVTVNGGENVTITDSVIDSIFVYDGGKLTLTRCQVNGTIVVLPGTGGQTKLHMTNCSVLGGMTVNAVDGQGNLYWGSEVPVDLVLTGSFIYYPQGNAANGDHTEALASFGWIRGGRITGCSIVQQGPNNQTATATMNWHGADTIFDGCYFDWQGGVAAYFTLYCEGRNNIIRNSFIASTGDPNGYVYPDSNPHASYINCKDLASGRSLTLP